MGDIVTRRIDAAADPWSAASFFMEHGRGTILFDNQTGDGGEHPCSLVMTEPRRLLVERDGRFVELPTGRDVADPVAWMKESHRGVVADESVPFCGGLAGYLGFEFGWNVDNLGVAPRRASAPDLWVGEFAAAAMFDHRRGQWTVAGREDGAVDELARGLEAVEPMETSGRGQRARGRDVDAADYRAGVKRAVEAIYAGELFEVNYTERFHGRWSGDRRALYEAMKARAPGAFGGAVDAEEVFVASISPEQFLEVGADGRVVTRPIKGTRPRGETPQQDERLADELITSDKDRAENVMIVDLMRNDLTRVCQVGTVEATELCGLHSFDSVHHLVSTVQGQLAEQFDAIDAFVASFPAGSITGAPKLRSMEWVAENEASARGPYTGSMFYWSDHGRLDSNVLIRTAVLQGEDVEYGAGGAVVSDSEPAGEYEEALWKARPFFETLGDKIDRNDTS